MGCYRFLLVLASTVLWGAQAFSHVVDYASLSSSSSILSGHKQQRKHTLPVSPASLSHRNPKRNSASALFSFFDNNNDDNNKSGADDAFAAIARPDPASLLSAQDDTTQIGGVAAIGTGILLGTYLLVQVWTGLDGLLGGFMGTLLGFTVPIPLGLVYAALGVTHFVYKDGYASIVPPKGTWGGLWNVPAPGAEQLGVSCKDYHVLWTGVAEIGGGILLVLGGLNALPIQIPAFLLFCLTLAVTPANVYMFTHDAQLSFGPPLPYPEGHVFRGVLQCVLLSLLWFLVVQ